jgi:hypothetical protein
MFSPFQDLFTALPYTCVLILLFSFAVFAQDSGDVIRVDTELISFEVAVTDKNGKPVRGLDAKDFKVFEDGVERPIEFFEPIKKADDGRPLSIVFALDVSGSVTGDELVSFRRELFATRKAKSLP